ncbi:MAG TPA: hypothetical protein VK640_12530, partial [Actinomycetes bacterium]|nr:hypothetical protein [Actinomycetes bacterium]
GEYFVDDPEYIHVTGTVPAGATALRFRYSTDAAYLDTGWFIDDVTVGGVEASLAPNGTGWVDTTGIQENNWSVQLVSACDLTPGVDGPDEIVDSEGNHVYQLSADESGAISASGFTTRCANGTKKDVTAVVSNLPDGDLDVLDADYTLRLVGGSAAAK